MSSRTLRLRVSHDMKCGSDSLLVHTEQPVAVNPLAAFIKFAPATTYRADIGTDQPADPIKQ